MLTLTLTGQLVDLPADAEVALSFRASNLANVESRESGFSESFLLPLTARNVRVLETAHSLDSDTATPYRRLPAVLEQNDVPVLVGHALLQRAAEGYEVLLLQGAGSLMAEVSDRNLRELDLSAYDHPLTFESVRDSQDHTAEEGYTYLYADTGRLTDRGEGFSVLFDELPHSVYSLAVLRQIVAESLPGYTLAGSLLTDTRFLAHQLPQATPFPQLRAGYCEANSVKATTTSQQVSTSPARGEGGSILIFDSITTDPGSRLQYGPNGDCYYQVPAHPVDVQVTALLRFTLDGPNVQPGSGSHPKATIRIIDEATDSVGGETLIYEGEWESFYAPRQRVLELDFTLLNIRADSKLRVQAYLRDGLRLTLQPESEVTFTLLPRVWRTAPVHLDASLPDLSQSDFLLLLANQFNVLFQADAANRVLRVDLFNDLAANRAKAVDWTRKIDYGQRPALAFVLSELAQRNLLRYADAPDAYRTLAGVKRTGQGTLLVPNTTLEKEREAYTAPVALVEPHNALFNRISVAYLPLLQTGTGQLTAIPYRAGTTYNETSNAVWFGGRPWVPTVPLPGFSGDQYPPDLTSGKWRELPEADVLTVLNEEMPLVGLLQPLTAPDSFVVNEDAPSTRSFVPRWALSRQGLSFDTDLLPRYFPLLQQVYNRVVVLECFVRLTPVDIATLDFTVPVRLNVVHWPGYGPLQGDFYLQLIDQYQPGTPGPVRCELVGLNGPVVSQASLSERRRIFDFTFDQTFN